MILAVLSVLATMSSADAIATLLNSRTSVGARVFAEAKETVEREAAEGKALQQFVIGVTTDDAALARRYLDASRDRIRMLAEKRNNPLAWYLLSMEKNDFSYLRKAADGGNVQALNALGAIATQEAFNRNGITSNGLERVLVQSYGFFRRAAMQRDPNGLINLGTCYLRGFGCRQDMALAFKCFSAAAAMGHPEGMDNMSACYQFGHGVPKDSELSLYWAMRGRAIRGDAAAEKWLRDRR